MTRVEVLQMLSLLQAAYPAFYSRQPRDQMKSIELLWCEMFEKDDFQIVKFALKNLIETHSGYPPDIAAVKQKIQELISAATGEPTDEDLWQILKKAVSNSNYCAKEEFDKLPPVLKAFVGSPSTLRDYAGIDSETFNTVSHGQFLKQIPVTRCREEYRRSLPGFIADMAERMRLKESESLDPNEVNSRRNAVLNALEGGK